MELPDARTLSPQAQEALRKRTVRAVVQGMTQTEAARVFGVARGTVSRWMQEYRRDGEAGLATRPRGRPPAPLLSGEEAETIVELLMQHPPDELGLPFPLWTREAVAALVEEETGLSLSVWTIGRYLRAWGLTPQKPARQAYERDPEAVGHWLETAYPAVRREAQAEGAEIHWADEMAVRSDHQAGRTWGRKGQTPALPQTGERHTRNVIAALTNHGTLRFRVFQGPFTAEVFVDFLRRLVRARERKVYLLVDRHPVHGSRTVERWVARHQERIRLVFLPTYSPELNPTEFLNQDVKANAVGRQRPQTAQQMTRQLRGYLRSTQRRLDIVQRYFQAPSVRYAA